MKLPDFKKKISFFLSSEEAKALKKNIAKLGLTAAVVAGIMVQNEPAQAAPRQHTDTVHDDGHADYTGHTDYGHNDYTNHTDGHSDSAHGDSCIPGAIHSSYPVYDSGLKRGGHSSDMVHDSCT
jgi:hypothetical protein